MMVSPEINHIAAETWVIHNVCLVYSRGGLTSIVLSNHCFHVRRSSVSLRQNHVCIVYEQQCCREHFSGRLPQRNQMNDVEQVYLTPSLTPLFYSYDFHYVAHVHSFMHNNTHAALDHTEVLY